MRVGELSEECEIVAFQQAPEAVGHQANIVCPDTAKGYRLETSVHDFGMAGVLTYTEHPGHDIAMTRFFDAVDTGDYDSVSIAGGRGPESIRTFPRVQQIVREFHGPGKPIAQICHGVQVLVAVPEVIEGKRVTGLFTCEPQVALTGATFVKIGPIAARRDGKLVTAEGWTALAALIREVLYTLGTEIVHHPVGALEQAAAEQRSPRRTPKLVDREEGSRRWRVVVTRKETEPQRSDPVGLQPGPRVTCPQELVIWFESPGC